MRDYIAQVLMVVPSREGVPVQFVHYPQPHELLVLNLQTRQQQSDMENKAYARHFLCGKNDGTSVYETILYEPVCIVQFKPHAWYAFGKNDVVRYANKVIRLKCDIGESLKMFVETKLPTYLFRYFKGLKVHSDAYRMMPKILDHIERQLNTVNVMNLANAFRMSEATLRRHFKKYVGMNVSHYIRSRKVHQMTVKMYRSEYNAITVQECGFYDQSHFIREFKRQHGTTPTKFMQQLQNVFGNDRYAEQLFNACYVELT